MNKRLFIGNQIIKLEEVDSTNNYLQELIFNSEKEIEGLVVISENQYAGKGQRGNFWESNKGENLTFSILFKPNLFVQQQFFISKIISLSIVDFLNNLGLINVTIKWPNDIYCSDKKIAGILIENSLKQNKISHSIVGIGLNVNQREFNSKLVNPTSIHNELASEKYDLTELLHELLFFVERRYLLLISGKIEAINSDYLLHLYGINEERNFKIKGVMVNAKITGITSIGKLQLKIEDKEKEFDLKDVEFIIRES